MRKRIFNSIRELLSRFAPHFQFSNFQSLNVWAFMIREFRLFPKSMSWRFAPRDEHFIAK